MKAVSLPAPNHNLAACVFGEILSWQRGLFSAEEFNGPSGQMHAHREDDLNLFTSPACVLM